MIDFGMIEFFIIGHLRSSTGQSIYALTFVMNDNLWHFDSLMIMADGIFVGFCESQVHGNEERFTINMVSLIRKTVREFFRTKYVYEFLIYFFLEFESKRAF